MAIGHGELMHECFPKHLRMGTIIQIADHRSIAIKRLSAHCTEHDSMHSTSGCAKHRPVLQRTHDYSLLSQNNAWLYTPEPLASMDPTEVYGTTAVYS